MINLIHLCGIFTILIRAGFSTFRLFRKTRHLACIILTILIDIEGFFSILLYAVIFFSLIFLFLQENMQEVELQIGDNNLEESLKMSYRMMYADWKDNFDLHTPIGFIFFIMATMFIIVIMFNMLISIISDTFDRV